MRVKVTKGFLADNGMQMAVGQVIRMYGRELAFRLDEGEVTKDLYWSPPPAQQEIYRKPPKAKARKRKVKSSAKKKPLAKKTLKHKVKKAVKKTAAKLRHAKRK